MRIISLVPSLTETVAQWSDPAQLIGCTSYCVRPRRLLQHCTTVGGTKNPNIETIRSLRPDLILMNKEENRREDASSLREFSKVWVCEVRTLDDVPVMLGELSEQIETSLEKPIATIDRLLQQPIARSSNRTAYLIWNNPMMAVGGDTYISSCLERLGYQNFFKNMLRYPTITEHDLMQVDTLFLSSEPFAFRKRHLHSFCSRFPHLKVHLIDGRLMSWYGFSTVEFLQHPERCIRGS